MGRVISTALQFIDNFTNPSMAALKQMQKMGREAQAAGKQIQAAGKSIQKVGSSLTNAITKPALTAAGALTTLVMTKGFARLTDIDNAKGSLQGLGHSAEAIDTIMTDALASVKGTAFGLGEAAQTAAGAVASGVEPGKELERVLSLTADAATIGKSSMGEMGAIFNKVQASNKVSAREANQMIMRGIPIYQMLADVCGKSVEQVREDMSKGAISADLFYNAIEKGMGGAAKYLGNDTVSGAIKNTSAALGRLGAAFLSAGENGGLFGTIAPTLSSLQKLMDDFAGTAEEWGAVAGEAVNKFIQRVKDLKNWFDSLSPAMQGNIGKFAAFAVAVGPAITIFGKLVTSVGTGIKVFGTIKKVVGNFGGVMGLITSPAGTVITVLIGIAVATILIIKNWDKVKSVLSGVGGWFKNVFDKAGFSTEQFKLRFQSMGQTLGSIGGKIGSIVGGIAKTFGKLFGADIASGAADAEDMFSNIVVAVIGAFDKITLAVDGGIKIFNSFIDFFTGGFAGDWESAAGGFRESIKTIFPKNLSNDLIQIFDNLLPGIVIVVESVKKTFAGLVADIKPIINNFKSIFQGVSTIFKGLFGGDIETVISGFKQALNGAIDGIGNVFKTKLNAIKTFALSILSNFLPQETIDKIASAFDGVAKAWDVAISAAKGYVDGFVTAIRPLFNNIKTILSGLGTFVKSVLTGDWKGALNGLKTIARGALSGLVTIFKAPFILIGSTIKRVIKDFDGMKIIRSIFNSIGSFLSGILSKCGIDMNAFGATIGRIVGKIRNIINNLRSIFSIVFRFIRNIAKSVGTAFESNFGSKIKAACSGAAIIVRFLWDVIGSVFGWIADKIGTVAKFVSSSIKLSFSAIKIVIETASRNISIIVEGVITTFEGITTFISGVFEGDWSKAWEGVKMTFEGVFGGIKDIGKNIINGLIDFINLGIGKINSISFSTPDWMPGIGGKTFSMNIPEIPKLFTGTRNWGGGIAMIHDRGGEIVDLPQGSRVYPHDKSVDMARKEGAAAAGGCNITINKLADKIEVRNDSDIDRIAEALALRLQKVMLNMGNA